MFDLQVLLELVDHLTGPLRGPMAALSELEQRSQAVDHGLKMMGNGVALAGAAGVLAAPFILATHAAMDFESVMADVKKVVNFNTPQQFVQMRSDLMALSETIPVTAQGFGEIAAAAGQAGIATGEIVEFSRDAAKMAVAFDLTAAQAGTAMTGLRNIFHLTQSDVVLLGDSVNNLSNNMDAKAYAILDVLNRAGSTGRLVGLTGQQVAALGATFTALKSPPEVAGTAINAMLMKMETATQQGKTFQKGLHNIGLDALTLAKHMRVDAQGAIIDFLQRVRGSKDVVGVLNQLFGQEYSDDIAKLVGGLNTYKQALGLVGSTSAYAGSMNKEYAARADTTANSLLLLKNVVTNTGIELGTMFLPPIRHAAEYILHLVQQVRGWAEAHPALTRVVVGTQLAVIALLLALAGMSAAAGGYVVGSNAIKGALVMMRAQMAATRTAAILLQGSLMSRVTLGVPSAAQAAQMASAWGRLGVVLQGVRLAAIGALAPLLANPITWIVAAVIGLGAAFVYAWHSSEEFRDNIVRALQPVQDAWARLGSGLSGLLNTVLPNAGAQLQKFVGQMGGWLGTAAYGIGWFLGFTFTAVTLLGSFLLSKFIDTFGGVITFLTGAWNFVAGILTGNSGQVELGVNQMLDGLAAIWQSTLGWIIQLVVNFGGKLWTHITDAVSHVSEWLSTKVGDWTNMGANLIQGLIDGIQSKIGGVLSEMQDLAGQVSGIFTGHMQMHSPSRLFMGYGEYITEGLALGIAGSAGAPVAATKSMAADVAGAGVMRLPGLAGPEASGPVYSMAALGGGSGGRAGGSAGSAQTGGRSIVIQNLHVTADNADEFVASLRRFTEDHQ